MLTRTSELTIQALIVVALEGKDKPMGPKAVAERLDCSVTYLAKTLGLLVKAGILHSVRGPNGGMVLAQQPEHVTLLAVVEACQGLLIGNYCRDITGTGERVCAFHQAMKEVHTATVRTLSKWTLADLMTCPASPGIQAQPTNCKMAFKGCERHLPQAIAPETQPAANWEYRE